MINIMENGIETILDSYVKIIPFSGYILNDNLNFNDVSLTGILQLLQSKEQSILIKLYNSSPKYPDTILNKCINYSGTAIDFIKYRTLYYERNFNEDVNNQQAISNICKEYFKGITFVIQYYNRYLPTNDWFYPYFYSPLMTDLAYYSATNELNFTFEYKPPLHPLQCLASIIHPNSFFLLPLNIKKKFDLLISNKDPDFPLNIKLSPSIIISFVFQFDQKEAISYQRNIIDP